jgi:hypothetical protein
MLYLILKLTDYDVQKFSSEAVTWKQLSHPNILPLYGILNESPQKYCFVCPWMENGNVVDFLKDQADNHSNVNCVRLVSIMFQSSASQVVTTTPSHWILHWDWNTFILRN